MAKTRDMPTRKSAALANRAATQAVPIGRQGQPTPSPLGPRGQAPMQVPQMQAATRVPQMQAATQAPQRQGVPMQVPQMQAATQAPQRQGVPMQVPQMQAATQAPQPMQAMGGGGAKFAGMKKGGMVKSSASSRGDGIAQRGKTRGKYC